MWLPRPPADELVQRFLAEQEGQPFTYPHVGGTTADTPPDGYDFDHNRVQLGVGQAPFAHARAPLRGWRQFPSPWTRAVPGDAPVAAGTVVGVLARVFGLWSLNAARVVYTVEESRAFGLAYGTLPGHVEEG